MKAELDKKEKTVPGHCQGRKRTKLPGKSAPQSKANDGRNDRIKKAEDALMGFDEDLPQRSWPGTEVRSEAKSGLAILDMHRPRFRASS